MARHPHPRAERDQVLGLTEELVQRAGKVVAVEIDEELASLTRGRLATHANLEVVAADVLDFTPLEMLEEGGAAPPYVACGNLPYYITQPVVRRLVEAEPPPERKRSTDRERTTCHPVDPSIS